MAQSALIQASLPGTPLTAGAHPGPRQPKGHSIPQRPAPERRTDKTSGV